MAPYTQTGLGTYQQPNQQNPLQWLLDINQQAGNAVVEQITNLPGNLLKIGQGALEDLVERSVNQAEQREENLKTGGWTGFKQKMTDSAGMLIDGATVGGWVDVAGMGLMEASGADFVPENLRLPLLIGGMAVSAADGTPSMLTPRQLARLSKISPTASTKLKTGAGKPATVTRKLTGSQINTAITPEGVLNRYGVYKTVNGKRVRVPLDDELPTPGRKDQHHWIPKDVRYDFTVQAQKLDPKGKAQLDAIDAEYDLQAGGGSKGVTTMDMMAHLPMHGRIKGAGYEVSGKLLKEFRQEIAGITDIEQLKAVYRTWLEKNVVPTVGTVQALQGGYDMLEAGGKKVSKEALLEAAYGKGGWVERQLAIVENRIERAYEQGVAPRRSDILFKVRAEQDALNNLSL